MTTEEQLIDFQRVLTRPTFEEMVILMVRRFLGHQSHEPGDREVFLNEHGWTRDDYETAHHALIQRGID